MAHTSPAQTRETELRVKLDGQTEEAQRLFHCLERIAAAQEPEAVVRAVQSYLNSWPRERIENLQRVDGGRAPFERDKTPSTVKTVQDLKRFRDAVHRQCDTLRQTGIRPVPELVEIDEILFIAVLLADSMRLPGFRIRSSRASTGSPLLNLL